MHDIPDHVHNMCLWAVSDDGTIDEEMVDIILENEDVLIREGRRSDLIFSLSYFHLTQIAKCTPEEKQALFTPSDSVLQKMNELRAIRLRKG